MRIVSKQDGMVFGVAGLLAWTAATAYYAAFGGALIERAFWFYAVNAFLAAGATGFLFHAALLVTRTPQRRKPIAAVAFAAPGVVLGGLLLAFLTDIFPHLEAVSVGRYGAFLFVGYALVVAAAFERELRTVSSRAQ